MRILSITALTGLALTVGATLVNWPAASALVALDEFHQPSMMIDQLTMNAKNLPVQSFDTF